MVRRRRDEDFADEIGAHIDLEAQRLIDEGLPPAEARAAARRAFGSVAAATERYYEAGRIRWLDQLRQDTRAALRNMTKYPVACIVAILSLAGGIGATSATLTVRNVVFRNPPPLYPHPEQISRVQVGRPDRPFMPVGNPVPGALFALWRETPPSGSSIAGITATRIREVRTADRTATVPIRSTTPEFFTAIGVAPAQGQVAAAHVAAIAAASGAPPAVLSYRVWQTLLDARPDAVGTSIWIDNRPHTVAAVMPERFWFSWMDSPIWTPVDAAALHPDESVEVIVRRPTGLSGEALGRQLQAGLAEFAGRQRAGERDLRLKVSDIGGTPLGNEMSIALPWLMAASVLLTLLIACANVAILMIAQWTAREHEIAIRASLGASRGRIVRGLLTESVVVASCGGMLGVAAAYALLGVIIREGGPATLFFDLSVDPRVLAQSAIVTLATGVLAGLAPALYETRRLHLNPLNTLSTPDRVRQRWRHALVVFEITVTVALLVVTATMVDGYRRSLAAEMGFPTRPLLTVTVENPAGVPLPRLLEILNGTPGVASASASTMVPIGSNGTPQRVAADEAGSNTLTADRGLISPGFFSTLDVPMRRGRALTGTDTPATRTAVVNETLAARLFAGREPIGAHIWIDRTAYEIVGVVMDYAANQFQDRSGKPRVFLPIALAGELKRVPILVRATGDPAPLVRTIRREIVAAGSGTAVRSASTFEEMLATGAQEVLVGTVPMVPLIAIGMLLTAAGVYGVLAFAITRRSKELAVRVAIGASGSDLVRLVSAQSVSLVATGLVLGLAATIGLRQVVRTSGGGGSMFDAHWPAFVFPVLIVAAVGALATWFPSRRALRINPAVLLRSS